MRPLYIFDLDGTLADISHRRPILDDKNNPKRWDQFYEACSDDPPNQPVLEVFLALRKVADVWVWSARGKEVYEKTIDWLHRQTGIEQRELEFNIQMREIGDWTPDEILKERWLDRLFTQDRERLVGVFDDRDKVVEMWRRRGITCFQVAPGGF